MVSVEDTDYMLWQTRLLVRSLQRHAPDWKLVIAVSVRKGAALRSMWQQLGPDVVMVQAPHFRDVYTDEYVLWNKPMGFKAALDAKVLGDGPLLLLDPDMILLHPVDLGVGRNRGTLFNDLRSERGQALLAFILKAKDPDVKLERFSMVGLPMVLYGPTQLAAICLYWERLLIDMRCSKQCREILGWWSEMWAFVGAAMLADLSIECDEHWCVSTDYAGPLTDDITWIHYCNTAAPLVCDKREHTKLAPLGLPPVIHRLVKEWGEV